jgi:hypothetical protein
MKKCENQIKIKIHTLLKYGVILLLRALWVYELIGRQFLETLDSIESLVTHNDIFKFTLYQIRKFRKFSYYNNNRVMT